MINFKEHDGLLFRMLEEPVPLTADAELPCLVRLIQDDTMLGKTNKMGCHQETLSQKIICIELTGGGLFMNGDYTYRYEIIGYPVAEGSADWALYQMMQGKCVCHVKAPSIKYYRPTHYVKRVMRENCTDDMYDAVWMEGADPTGWEIYKEPEPEYKVGDWVKYDIDYYLQVIEPSGKERTLCRTLSGVNVYPCTSCLTKASPSEVVIDFGSFSGWIKRASNYNIEVYSKGNCWLANLRFDMLDAPTRELVEGLLKAQDEEKLKGDNND
ncbi:MAG: hypothetical protein PHO37_19035 [Kiritimatiellae bacterium]|nr:hypothetical protein [Kiritimatiellia bacterium]